ncbi:MAG TPA: hypothetical protein VK912_15980 [Longimicrobiales bacterium]|nr:hypothetical protein [Longimicrobiales bacterium]
MNHRTGLILFVASAVIIAVAYASAFLPGGAPAWAAWLLAFGTATIMVAATMIGALRSSIASPGRLAFPFAFTWVVVFGGFALALVLPAETAGGPLWLGLPRRAAIILFGIGLLPMLVLPVAYARTFDDMTLSEEDLRRVREAAIALRSDAATEEALR